MAGGTGTLYRLGETDQTVADPAADVRGRTVVDRHGEEVGRVDDLLVDDRENRVRFPRVGGSGLLGIGRTHYLAPVDAVVSVDTDRVCIAQERGRMGDLPGYDPELADRPDYYDSVYGWRGTAPFRGPGHAYPPFPR